MKSVLTVLTLLVLFLSGCIAAPKNSRKSTTSSVTTTTTTSTASPTFASDEKLYWFSSAKTVGTITINKNNLNTYYLRGSYIHNFLNSTNSSGIYNYKKQYCLVGNFSSGTYKQIRVRAIPIATTSNSITERMLRIDFPVESDNYASCAKSTIDSTGFAGASYALTTICTSCSGKVTTSNLKLFTVNSTSSTLDTIDSSTLSTSSILLQVDLDSNATSDTSSCTNSSCSAKGFDCCIEGQCVNDGSQKTSASSSSDYAQAMSEYNANPLSFINWPNVFNICTNIAHSSVGGSTTSSSSSAATSLATAAERVAAYLKSWYCMEDVSAGSGYSRCTGTTLSGSLSAYDEVRYSLAVACGCTATQLQMDAKCPNWTVKPLYKSTIQTDENIIDFYCYTPIVESQVGSITNLNVSVSARSAPHRFFSTTGDNYDSISGLATTIKQEGTDSTSGDFYYQDENTKTGPQNGSFNINSVLGKMVVDLSRTAPAKLVTVELGKTYIVSATSGYFTPCPLCAKDSWFQSFFAHPNSQRGLGLQYSGYSTTRDAYGNNDTLGNYEDTHFGRACFLPVTMIPLAHQKESTLQSQRQDRLKTQAAFYINGYQRDWFGFNQGALIGSFDGVTWFGVGTGRRITATSTKLYLAFNAAFLDLATKTDTVVNIIPDSGSNTAPNVDFDADLSLKDPLQGTAATCQRFHQCETDAECVSQLGWEYVCADVSQYKTTWPIFDSNGNELKNQEKVATIFDILSGTISTTYTKRCVYRGAGAPCKRDFSSLDSKSLNYVTGLNETYRKMLTCAPNFYCASTSSSKFNDELARSPNEMDNIIYGMDANVLGRPLNYVTASKTLPNEVISNITYNGTTALNLGSIANDLGMCRPGKAHISSYGESKMITAHTNADSQKRTDYISQIGSCDSQVGGDARVLNCPVFDTDNNYLDYKTDPTTLAKQQNMCGGEAKHTSTYISGFKSIESLSLGSINSVAAATMVQDACLRRAGSICHTDLDCGPNSMHETLANSLNLAYFGGTEAERSYWAETLICGQGEAQPIKSDTKYLTYQLASNRCCREIGKDFTMYTKGDSTFIKDQTTTGSTTLDTTKFTTADPTAANRYSRYMIAPSAWSYYSVIDGAHDDQDIVPKIPLSTAATIHEPTPQQWQVVNETGSKTCCGGGWIRKFADGTHTWPIKTRLVLDTANFSCLNFRSPLTDTSFNSTYSSYLYSGLVGASNGPTTSKYITSQGFAKESDLLCKSPADGGCMQIPYKDSANFAIATPDIYFPGDSVWVDTESGDNEAGDLTGTMLSRFDTTPTEDPSASTSWTQRLNVDVPYAPIPHVHMDRLDEYQNTALNFMWSKTVGYSTHFYLPAYTGWDGIVGSAATTYDATSITNSGSAIQNVYIKYVYDSESGTKPVVQRITQLVATDNTKCRDSISKTAATTGYGVSGDNLTSGALTASWCIVSDAKTGNRPVVVVRADNSGTYGNWKYAGVIIDFKPLEYQIGSYLTDNPATLSVTGRKTAIPGNPQYYLTKLARLELLGIPQITYEPIYCSNDHNKLIPGLFKTTTASPLTTRSQFRSQSYTYQDFDPIESYNNDSSNNDGEQAYSISGRAVYYGNAENRFVYQNKVDHDAVFSSKDFTCCTPLGKAPKNGAASCCSGYSVTKNNVTTCKLPAGTDINVYFNKFVSNEGIGSTQPGGGLISSHERDTDGDGTNDITDATAEDNIDFNPFTGEPKYRDSTYKKLYTLGVAYCSSGKVGTGAAFGSFPPEPFSGSYTSVSSTDTTYPTSIVDSIIDSDSNDANVGKIMFDQGYRWNNHYYCK